MATTPNKTKTRTTYTPSERAVRAVKALSFPDLVKFCKELDREETDVADFIVAQLQSVTHPAQDASA